MRSLVSWYNLNGMKPNQQVFGHLLALFTILIWGITFISTKVLLASFSPVEVMFFRLVFAVLALMIASPPRWNWNGLGWQTLRQEWKVMAAGLCGVTLYFLFQNIALEYTQAANVGVLVSVVPLFTALVSRAVFGEKLKANFFLGFSAAIVGITLITFNGSLVLKLNPLGDLLSILAALVWAFYSVLIKKIGAAQDTMLTITRKVVFYGLLFLLPVLPLFGFHLGLERLVSLPNLLNLLFLGVGSSAISFLTWNSAVQILGPVRTSAYIYLVPIVAIIASVWVLHETITLVAWAGAALILSGMALSERDKNIQLSP